MKSPPVQYRDTAAAEHVAAFIAGEDATTVDLAGFLAG
jgi:hypothetical protein